MTGTFSESCFKALLTLVAVALSTNVLVGSSDRWRPVFITAILGVTITSEYYYLFFAIMKVPRDWATNRKAAMYRWDCLESSKGGKRGEGSTGLFDINPCFCPSNGYCKNLTSDQWLDSSVCPKDGTASCWDTNKTPVDLYVKSTRDCTNAQGARCTKDEPCTPCGLDTLEAFLTNDTVGYRTGVSRCPSCGAGNSGACNFIMGQGPYCWKAPGSREVEPCSVCCTEPTVLFLNGSETCH